MKLILFPLFCVLFAAAPSVWSQDCPCEDVAPDETYSCAEQREFGQCEADWMQGFCLCTCGNCAEDDISTTEFISAESLPPKPETDEVMEAVEETRLEAELAIDVETSTEDLQPLRMFANNESGCLDALLPAISGSEELTVLGLAVERTGLDELFADRTLRATLFAPTNEAFEETLQSLNLSLSGLLNNSGILTALLQYHLIPGRTVGRQELARSTMFDTALEDYELIGGSTGEIEGFASVGNIVGEPVRICRSLVYLVDNVLLPEGTVEELTEAFAPETVTEPEEEEPSCREGFNAFFAISSDEELSIFADLLNLVQLSGPLAREVTSFTVFAPTNEAFNSTLEALNLTLTELQADEELLEGILRYHIIRRENLEASALNTSRIETINGSTIFVEVDGGVELSGVGSGASVITPDIDLSCQSAVHKIDNVLLPFRTQRRVVSTRSRDRSSTKRQSRRGDEEEVELVSTSGDTCQVGNQNLYQVLSGTQTLRVWTQIIQLSGLREFLTNKSVSVTMFAPNDAAFGALLPPGAGFSELVPHSSIAQVLVSYHTVNGAATTRQIQSGQEVETLLIDQSEEEPVEITIEDNPLIPTRLMVSGKESTANIVQTNIIGCNSVIHIIDSVLLPYEDVFPSETIPLDEAISAAEGYSSILVEANTEEEEPRRRRRRGRGRTAN